MGTAPHVFLWALGGLALIALAGPAPNIATLLVVILIVGLLLAHWHDYAMYVGQIGTVNPRVKKNA